MSGNNVTVRLFVGNTAWGCLTLATLPPTHTLTQVPQNLTLVVVTPKRLGALPVVVVINRLVLKELKNNMRNPRFRTTTNNTTEVEKIKYASCNGQTLNLDLQNLS